MFHLFSLLLLAEWWTECMICGRSYVHLVWSPKFSTTAIDQRVESIHARRAWEKGLNGGGCVPHLVRSFQNDFKMGVSKNSGFSPQIIHLFIGFSIIYKPSILGNPTIFGNPPNDGIYEFVDTQHRKAAFFLLGNKTQLKLKLMEVKFSRSCRRFNLSRWMEKRAPGCLGWFWGMTSYPINMGILISQYNDPGKNQPGFNGESRRVFFRSSTVSSLRIKNWRLLERVFWRVSSRRSNHPSMEKWNIISHKIHVWYICLLIYHTNQLNLGTYTIHRSCGYE